MKVLQIVIYQVRNGNPFKVVSNEIVDIETDLSVEEFKSKLREERNLSSEYIIDLTYAKTS